MNSAIQMLTSFCIVCFGKIVDNDTSYPGPFLEFFKRRNNSSQITSSFEHREETGSALPLL